MRIVYTRPDGGVSVVTPASALVMEFHLYGTPTGTLQWSGPPVADPRRVMSLDAAELAATAFVRAKDVPGAATNIAVLDMESLPPSRRFRNCWRQAGVTVPSVDMPLARVQRMTEIRAERDKRLVASDGLIARVQDIGTPADVAALRVYRQALRDVPQTVNLESVTTSEALAGFEPVWPSVP